MSDRPEADRPSPLPPRADPPAEAGRRFQTVLFGTYARGDFQGLYAAELDRLAGRLAPARRLADLPNPGFIAVAADGRRLVVVGRGPVGSPTADGRIAALRIAPDVQSADLLNELPTRGQGPCHVALHPRGRFAAVAHYAGGSVEIFALDDDGKIDRPTDFVQHHGAGVDPERQTSPHVHSAQFDPAGRHLLTADLGLDQVTVYPFDARRGALGPPVTPPGAVPPGQGPRHAAFHPDGSTLFVINEMGATVTVFRYEPETGALERGPTVDALPADYQGPRRAAEILVHPAGRFLYCSHRGEDTVATLALDPAGGPPRRLGAAPTGGAWPRSFDLDADGQWIVAANQNGGNAAVLRIEPETGLAVPTGCTIDVPDPVCVRLLPQTAPRPS